MACVVGLGHEGVAFSVDIDDVSQPWRPTKGSLLLYQCSCADGTTYWANLELTGGLLAPFTSFTITVRDNLGNVLVAPTDAKLTGWKVDLRVVPANVPFVQVDYDGSCPTGTSGPSRSRAS